MKDMIPDRTVTIVAGDGGGGKTTLMLHLAAAIAGERPWLGHNPDPGPRALSSLQKTMKRKSIDACLLIAKSLDVDLSDLATSISCRWPARTPLWAHRRARPLSLRRPRSFVGSLLSIERIRPRLVVLDALADVYAGEENARAQARQFIGLLRGLAIKHDLAVVLIAHPSLSGMAADSGTSGSTAWSNSVRARLYLERILDEGNREIDPDLRVLRVKKSNYGPVGLELRLRWQSGAFVLDGNAASFDKLAAHAKAERVFSTAGNLRKPGPRCIA